MAEQLTVGLAGVGNMGAPMARNLARAGFRVVLFDLSSKALEPFGADAAFTIAANLVELGRRCPVVITMLPRSDAVRAAALGGDHGHGIVDGMDARAHKPGDPAPVLIDMSSSYAVETQRLGAELAMRGVRLVDAPVSGGVPKAKSGTLAIMAGGAAADIDRIEPILASMGTVIRTGALGSGHAIKALNNYVSAAGLIATCEALLIGERFGLEPVTIARVLNASTGRNNTTENKLAQYLIPRVFRSGFALDLMAKDVGMARRLAAELGIAAHQLAHVAAALESASQALGAGADHTAVMRHVEHGATTERTRKGSR